jgi:hypothetical protein
MYEWKSHCYTFIQPPAKDFSTLTSTIEKDLWRRMLNQGYLNVYIEMVIFHIKQE